MRGRLASRWDGDPGDVRAGGAAQGVGSAFEQIAGIRRIHELLLHRSVEVRLRPILRLADDKTFGWSAIPTFSGRSTAWDLPCEARTAPAAAAFRLRQLCRLRALREFSSLPQRGRLVIAVAAWEVENAVEFRSSIERLVDELSEPASLIAAITDATTCRLDALQAARNVLDELGVSLALECPASEGKQLVELAGTRPTHLILTSRSFRDISQRRPTRRQLTSVLAAFHDTGCSTIAHRQGDENDGPAIRELGFEFACTDANRPKHVDITPAESSAKHEDSAPEVTATPEKIAEAIARIRASCT